MVLKPYFLSLTLVAILVPRPQKPYYLIEIQVFYALPSIELRLIRFADLRFHTTFNKQVIYV